MKTVKKYINQVRYLVSMLKQDALEIAIGDITIDFYFFEINIYIN